jgi:hypothetical protein
MPDEHVLKLLLAKLGWDEEAVALDQPGRVVDLAEFQQRLTQFLDGLVGGDGFAADASLIKADANRQRSAEGWEEVDWEAMAAIRRSVREYLDTLDEAAWGAASEVRPKFVSQSDPAAQWTGALKGHAFFAYAANYLIDLDHAVIVDVEASRAIRRAEVGAARTMIDRTLDRFGLYPERLAADAAYGSAENLAWLVHEHGIEPHIPVFDHSQHRDGTFERAEFTYGGMRGRMHDPSRPPLARG